MTRQLRVMVVDDSAAYRALLVESVNASGFARVVTTAADGREALRKFEEFHPDLLTVDVEMPVMGGLELLQALRAIDPIVPILMVSALTTKGARESVRALELGATEIITKPQGATPQGSRDELRARMRALLEALAPVAPARAAPHPTPRLLVPKSPPRVVGIGSSTGGPGALATIIPALPRDLPVPVLVVQHMPPMFTASLAEMLARKSAIRVVEVKDGEELLASTVYIAPGGRHLRVRAANAQVFAELTDDPPEHHCRPAVDYLFRSLAQTYREAAMGVILTGMGKDGTLGLRLMKRHGAYVVGQDAESCTVYGMPREAMEAGVVDVEVSASQMASAIIAAVCRGGRG